MDVDVNIERKGTAHRRKRFLLKHPFYVSVNLTRKDELHAGTLTIAKRSGHSMLALTWIH